MANIDLDTPPAYYFFVAGQLVHLFNLELITQNRGTFIIYSTFRYSLADLHPFLPYLCHILVSNEY